MFPSDLSSPSAELTGVAELVSFDMRSIRWCVVAEPAGELFLSTSTILRIVSETIDHICVCISELAVAQIFFHHFYKNTRAILVRRLISVRRKKNRQTNSAECTYIWREYIAIQHGLEETKMKSSKRVSRISIEFRFQQRKQRVHETGKNIWHSEVISVRFLQHANRRTWTL